VVAIENHGLVAGDLVKLHGHGSFMVEEVGGPLLRLRPARWWDLLRRVARVRITGRGYGK